jgi:hypothetical protein
VFWHQNGVRPQNCPGLVGLNGLGGRGDKVVRRSADRQVRRVHRSRSGCASRRWAVEEVLLRLGALSGGNVSAHRPAHRDVCALQHHVQRVAVTAECTFLDQIAIERGKPGGAPLSTTLLWAYPAAASSACRMWPRPHPIARPAPRRAGAVMSTPSALARSRISSPILSSELQREVEEHVREEEAC